MTYNSIMLTELTVLITININLLIMLLLNTVIKIYINIFLYINYNNVDTKILILTPILILY